MGTPDFAVPTLVKIAASSHELIGVVTSPDKPAGRGKHLQSSAVKKAALLLHLPILQPVNLQEPDFIRSLQELNADIFVVVAFRLLPAAVFSIPPGGTINLHASLLPRYRGAAPINWALIRGERETGVTTFYIDEKMDTGKILLQIKIEVDSDINAGDLHDRLSLLGADLVLQTLDGLAARTLQAKAQQGEACPAPKLTRDLGAIAWESSAPEIHNLIRGLSPAPCAFTTWRGQRLKLLRAKALAEPDTSAGPGTVVRADKKGPLWIQTGKGILEILHLQLEGKKAMAAEEFIRGYKIAVNETLITDYA